MVRALRIQLLLVAFLIPFLVNCDDLDSLCKGYCMSRYMDGFFYAKTDKCACVDYINLPNGSYGLPKRIKSLNHSLPDDF